MELNMTKRQDDNPDIPRQHSTDAAPLSEQLAQALLNSEPVTDAARQERSNKKFRQLQAVLSNLRDGDVAYGSRTPLPDVPAWATLEVMTGGFATGNLLAGGALQPHERKLMQELGIKDDCNARRKLNAWFLGDADMAQLAQLLTTGCYDLTVPEEGALLVVAWLLENRQIDAACELLSHIAAWMPALRFYPVPLATPRRFGACVHVRDVNDTINQLKYIRPHAGIMAQKRAVHTYAPFYDAMVALLLETVQDDWPCRHYPAGWSNRALTLIREYGGNKLFRLALASGELPKPGKHREQLTRLFEQCARQPESLSGREVGRIRQILQQHVRKWGIPGSEQCQQLRQRQQADVAAPMHHLLAGVLVERLKPLPGNEGLDNVSVAQEPVKEDEALRFALPAGTSIPASLQRKVERSLNETIAVLIERGLITSGEALARVLPQMTADIRASGIQDPQLRQLYAAIYRAFRQRRSLLLTNLEKQVQIEELPWVAAIEKNRKTSVSARERARQTLEELGLVSLNSFPHAILPNKLLQELRALAKSAQITLPLVDELAADIFMGTFSGKFVDSGCIAAQLLQGSLYERYFNIDFSALALLAGEESRGGLGGLGGLLQAHGVKQFGSLCTARAGVAYGRSVAGNGMIIEQQQILTTQNLAALVSGLQLQALLAPRLDAIARRCLEWICRVLCLQPPGWHAQLINLKNAAYGWRQMVFFLSLMSEAELNDFMQWADTFLAGQSSGFVRRFRPAWLGLALAAQGKALSADLQQATGAKVFLGWAWQRHWLLEDEWQVRD